VRKSHDRSHKRNARPRAEIEFQSESPAAAFDSKNGIALISRSTTTCTRTTPSAPVMQPARPCRRAGMHKLCTANKIKTRQTGQLLRSMENIDTVDEAHARINFPYQEY
jgi:hypothetical protein